MTTAEHPPATYSAEALAGRLLEATLGTVEVFSVYLGEQLGLYRALAKGTSFTAADLAGAAGIHERYAREWLEQQATAGFIHVENAGAAPGERRYSLPGEHAPVLVDRDSDFFVAPVGRFGAAIFSQTPAILEAYRTGGGVSWDRFGADARTAQADFNRPFFLNGLVPGYLSQVPGLEEALRRPGARAAEIGCGGGWALIALARAYPGLVLEGFDIDRPTVEMARQNVAEAGLQGRVTVHCRDAADLDLNGQFDLVSAFECIHDLPDPVTVLATMRRLARPGGTVVVMDERVGDHFGSIGDFNERLFYGFSIGVCLPDGMSHQQTRATGTVMRAPIFEGYAREAGFSRVEVLSLEHDLFRFYRLEP